VIIEGVNLRIRHTRPNQTHPQGGRIEREMPIHASNVMPLDTDGNPTRVGRKRIAGSGDGSRPLDPIRQDDGPGTRPLGA
jgi:large subunit ribosomal protein L24